MNSVACPTQNELKQFLIETTIEQSSSLVAEHLEECSTCREQLDSLTRGPREWLLPDREKATDTIPPTLPGYRIEAELGRGSFGIVWRAWDENLRRLVAIKQQRGDRADTQIRQRFIREAQAIAHVRHSNLVGVYDIITPDDDSPPIMIMECVEGPTLRSSIQNGVPARRAVELTVGLLEGLAAAHAVGITHRDVKPENVLLDSMTDTPKLVDFGLAHVSAFESRLTHEGMLLGTPAYMAPEQITEPLQAGPRADIYSAGATFYELLTGRPPFTGSVLAVLQNVTENDPAAPRTIDSTIPLDLETICLKAMAKEPSHRYPTAQEFADDLRRYLVGAPVLARPLSQIETVKRWANRNPRVALLSGLVMGLLLAVAFGSTLFAVALLREQDRTAQALANAQVNAEEARQAQQIAESNEAAAKTAQGIAAQSYNVLFVEFQNEMRTRPGMTSLYQRIVKRCLEGYEKMAQAGEKSPNLDRSTVTATFHMGQTQFELGQITEAKRSYLKTQQLAEQLLQSEPDNPNYRLDLAHTQQALGRLAQRELNWPEAERLFENSLQNSLKVAQTKPSDLILLQVGNLYYELGNVKSSTGRTVDARVDIEQSINILEPLLVKHPNDAIYLRALQLAHNELGKSYLYSNQPSLSIDPLEKALREAKLLWKLEPDNLLALSNVSVSQSILVAPQLLMDDVDAAFRYAEECRVSCQQLYDADPKRMLFRRGLSVSQERLGEVAFRQKRLEDAVKHYTESLNVINGLIAEDKDSVELLIDRVRLQLQLSVIEEHRPDYPRTLGWVQATHKDVKQLAKNPAMQAATTPLLEHFPQIELALTHIEAALKDPKVLEEFAEPTGGFLELFCSLNRVRAGQIDEALNLAKSAESRTPNDLTILQNTIRVYCLAACDPNLTQARRDELTTLAIDRFTHVIQLGGSYQNLYLEPDFDAIRNDPRFKQLARPNDKQ